MQNRSDCYEFSSGNNDSVTAKSVTAKRIFKSFMKPKAP